MVETSISEQVKEAFSEQMLMSKQIETALQYMANTNPIETVLRPLDGQDEKLRTHAQQYLQLMMQTWLETYTKALGAGQDLPVDLLGRAADLAKNQRAKYNEVSKTS